MTSKKIEGEWEIYYYKKTIQEGLTEFANSSGNLVFDDATNSYSLQIDFIFPSSSGQTKINGKYEVIEKGSFMNMSTVKSNGTTLRSDRYRILTQTDTDLQLEFTDTLNSVHNYLFRKK